MWSQSTNDALKARGKKDLDAHRLAVQRHICQCVYAIAATVQAGHLHATHAQGLDDDSIVLMEKTMVQGGSFVFEGDATLFEEQSRATARSSATARTPGSTTFSRRPAPRSHRECEVHDAAPRNRRVAAETPRAWTNNNA